MTGRVVVFGSLNVDTVSRVERLPRPGETVLATSTESNPGGKGGNQAAAACAAGADALLVSAVGYDGERYLSHLRRIGVDTSAVAMHPDVLTGSASIVVDSGGENCIVVAQGANARIRVEQLDAVGLRRDDTLLVQFELPAEVVDAAVARAAAVGARVIVNPSPWRDGVEAVFESADIVVVNELEAASLRERVPEHRICRTLGADGARWGEHTVPAPQIVAVDTTGAGDAFVGALAAALTGGAGEQEALVTAVEAASEVCLQPGAQRWHSLES